MCCVSFGGMHAEHVRYRRKSMLRRKGSSTVEETTTYAIASVVTPPEYQSRYRLFVWVIKQLMSREGVW